jgi:hypothetical protein
MKLTTSHFGPLRPILRHDALVAIGGIAEIG